jgi:hypothetical protein
MLGGRHPLPADVDRHAVWQLLTEGPSPHAISGLENHDIDTLARKLPSSSQPGWTRTNNHYITASRLHRISP